MVEFEATPEALELEKEKIEAPNEENSK